MTPALQYSTAHKTKLLSSQMCSQFVFRYRDGFKSLRFSSSSKELKGCCILNLTTFYTVFMIMSADGLWHCARHSYHVVNWFASPLCWRMKSLWLTQWEFLMILVTAPISASLFFYTLSVAADDCRLNVPVLTALRSCKLLSMSSLRLQLAVLKTRGILVRHTCRKRLVLNHISWWGTSEYVYKAACPS